jgi:Family of unknown function (DUF6304)
MREMVFPGSYRAGSGAKALEPLQWRVRSSLRPGWAERFEVHTTVRGVPLRGGDFDCLAAEEPQAAKRAGLTLARDGDLEDCVLTGDVPVTASVDGEVVAATLRFTLELGRSTSRGWLDRETLAISLELPSGTYEARTGEGCFEDGLLQLGRALPPGTRVQCCLTCRLSDYSPYGTGLTGMRCHRDARAQYLAVRGKADYVAVPLTEDVPEFYCCPQWEPRVPGTGYRG